MDPTPIILRHFESLKYAPPTGRFTVMAAFFLIDENDPIREDCVKIIAMATGTKCLAKKNYSRIGDAVHDFHAEVLARRCAVRWLLQEMAKESSEWLHATDDENDQTPSWSLRQGVTLNMYISELPCGEASMRAIAHLQSINDPQMAFLKAEEAPLTPGSGLTETRDLLARGREGYGLLNRVRTKPGRGDAPTTSAMSCSDKIALWCGVGVQGALLTSLGLQPIYINTMTIGSVQGVDLLSAIAGTLQADCLRAFAGRLNAIALEGSYAVHAPHINFTAIGFDCSRKWTVPGRTSSNEAMCWVAGETGVEVLVNGLRRGTLPRNRSTMALMPRVSKASLFALYQQRELAIQSRRGLVSAITLSATYYDAKHGTRSRGYHEAKGRLRGIGGPLQGWVICGTEYEMF